MIVQTAEATGLQSREKEKGQRNKLKNSFVKGTEEDEREMKKRREEKKRRRGKEEKRKREKDCVLLFSFLLSKEALYRAREVMHSGKAGTMMP